VNTAATMDPLARIVGRLRQLNAAADELSRAAETDPSLPERVGRVYTMIGAHDRAAPLFRRAVALMPTDANAHYSLGAALVFLGEFDEARAHLKRAVELEPRHFAAWYSLVTLEAQTAASNHLEALQAQFAGPDPDGLRTLHIGHALAKTYEDLGDYETAFDWLVKAKAERRKKANYSSVGEAATFAAAQAAAGYGKGKGFGTDEPIFIVGMPRSGTTLVEAIVSAHPDVAAGGELGLIPVLAQHFSGGADRPLLSAANFTGLADVDLNTFGRAYLEATRPVSGKSPRFLDKTTIDALYAGFILRALPNAKVICLRRDPMDSIVSYFRHMFFAWPHVYPSIYDLTHAAEHYVRFHALADHWRETLPADRYREQSYEALVADQEGQSREILEFLNLPFDQGVLSFHDRDNVVSTASAVQVRQPVYGSAVGRWKRYGDRLQPALEVLQKAGLA